MTGTVISLHRLGATIRLADGTLASVPLAELSAHYDQFSASLSRREPLSLKVQSKAGRRAAFLSRDIDDVTTMPPRTAEKLRDDLFEEQMRLYLKSTEEWAPPDRPAPADRHFIRKKRRAAHFEARTKGA